MGFNNKKGISASIILILFVLLNLITFLTVETFGLVFWIGYIFTALAFITALLSMFLFSGSDTYSVSFLRVPVVQLSWAYLLLQTAAGAWQVSEARPDYKLALIVDCVITVGFAIILLLSQSVSKNINKQDQQAEKKRFFLKNAQANLELIETADYEIKRQLDKLKEDFRFSDPNSHSMLANLEDQIELSIFMLKENRDNPDFMFRKIAEIRGLLKERNAKVKLYKNVKEPQKRDNSGFKPVAITVALVDVALVAVFVVSSLIIPSSSYKNAMVLYEKGEFALAGEAFKKLDGFKNSAQLAASCETSVKKKSYDAAKKLYDEKKYDEAITAFKALGDFKDSKEMIKQSEEKIKQTKYETAGKYLDKQNYVEAIKLYTELGNYSDSKEKIEQIYNRMTQEDEFYFGTYNGKPIAWQPLKIEDDRMLLITGEPICELPYNEDIENIEWNDSSLNTWLNSTFINSFSDEQKARIQDTEFEGEKNKVFILSEEDIYIIIDTSIFEGRRWRHFSREQLIEKSLEVLKCSSDWWLCTRSRSGTNAMYVDTDGEIVLKGDEIVRAKGVRPCIWIEL